METLYEKASLILNPGVYDTSKVYATKPFDGSGDLTFTRSNDTATRVASNGLIERVRTNLAWPSADFTTNWVPKNGVVTANTTANPIDGAITADTFTINAAVVQRTGVEKNFTASVGEVTASTYFKHTNNQWVFLAIYDTNNAIYRTAAFDIQNGVVGVKSSGVTSTITSVGGGFYRCSLTFLIATSTNIYHSQGVLNSNITGVVANVVGGESFITFGAQLEQGVLTDYIATTSAAVSVGPVANVPRLDYLGSSCPRLLLEPQRTNLVKYSEQFNNAGWAKSGASVLANAVLGPDGYTSADKLVEDTSTGAHIATQSNLFTATGAWHTASIFVKAAERTYAAFSTRGNFTSNDNTLIFNLTTGEWELDDSGQNYALNAEAFPNGWYRISLNTDTTSGAYDGFGIGIATGSTSWVDAVYTGDGTSGIYIWGAQMEAGQYESSLIPTLGSASTRGSDAASKTGISSLIGSAAGTIYVEFSALANDLSERRIALSDGTTGNVARVGYTNASNRILAVLFNGANQCVLAYDGADITQTQKVAFTWAANDFALFVNGVKRSSDVSGTTFAANTLTAINFNEGDGAGNNWYGDVDQLLLFKSRLSDSDLAALTA
jgi:hypothetical protein